MTLFQRLLHFLPHTCSHTHTYRERRKLHGVLVMHFVCERCGHASPAVERTARDHRRVVKIGDRPTARVVRQSGQVLAMDSRPRRKPA